jgi:hypothetical protein
MRRLVRLILLNLMLCAIATAAAAQTGATPSGPAAGPHWEVDLYGGLSLGRKSSGGSLVLPEPGAPIATSSPTFPSWRVPTWFLGDGAAFLNQVAEEFRVPGRITPLDTVLRASGLSDRGAIPFGARIRHPWRTRHAIEVGVDVLATNVGLSNALIDGVQAARTSFQTTFEELLATGPFTGPIVTTSSTLADGSSREIALTGALVIELAPFSGVVPFVVAGGGVLAQMGTPPTVSVEGRYRFSIAGTIPLPVDETDRLTLRYSQRSVPVGVVGGGVRRDLSGRWSVRVDARVLISPNTTRVAIDADPLVATGTPSGFVESFTHPNLQFSNNPSTGRVSTLSGSLSEFDAFKGGWQMRARVTFGISTKF